MGTPRRRRAEGGTHGGAASALCRFGRAQEPALAKAGETVVACVRIVSGGEVSRAVRTFATTTARLIELAEWLEASGCTQVAMEATGVYWKPVWQVLAGGDFTLVLANALHVKNVPGRKTDVNDATWLAELLAPGLIRASIVPGPEIQELRGLLRTRKQLVRDQAGVGSVRRDGAQRPGDDPGADRRRDRPC
jgi:transposase